MAVTYECQNVHVDGFTPVRESAEYFDYDLQRWVASDNDTSQNDVCCSDCGDRLYPEEIMHDNNVVNCNCEGCRDSLFNGDKFEKLLDHLDENTSTEDALDFVRRDCRQAMLGPEAFANRWADHKECLEDESENNGY